MSMNGKKKGIAVVLSGFPRRSETFALHEILALEARGMVAAIFATKPGDGLPPHPGYQQLHTPVQVLDGETVAEKANHLIECLSDSPLSGIHAYFAHLPAEIASLAAQQLHLPFGFSAHARDVRKVEPDALSKRIRQATCVVACNADVAATLKTYGAAVQLLPHGVDSQRFSPQPFPNFIQNSAVDIPSAFEPIRLLAVGRLVEKKGFDVLIQAVARLSVPFHLRIIGDGPERDALANAIRDARLEDRVTLCGSQTHAELPQAFADAHIVVVPSVMDRTGDRDGLPNVVLEAMACGRPVVASDVGAISSAVLHGQTGYLVPPGDAVALAGALEQLAGNPALWQEFGDNGRARVEAEFDLGICTERFCRFLASVYLP